MLAPIKPNKLRLLAFFINEDVRWFGDKDRFTAKLSTIQPMADFFINNCLSRLGCNFRNQPDYSLMAKNLKSAAMPPSGYITGNGNLLLRNLQDYANFFSILGEPENYYMIVQNELSLIQTSVDRRSVTLVLTILLLDSSARVVWSKEYEKAYPLSDEDMILFVGYQKARRKNDPQHERLLQIYSTFFLALTETVFSDLLQIVKSH